MPFVIDNSVVIGWHLSRWATAYSDAVLRALVNDNAHVPALWVFEFSNVMRRALLANKITEARCRESLQLQQGLALHADAGDPSEDLALRYQLSSYDAAYLDLALRMRLPVATADGALRDAAVTCGVGVFVP